MNNIAPNSAKQSFLPKKSNSTLKIGLFGIGLDTYWPQFEGLKERLEGYLHTVEQNLSNIHPQIVNAGLVDNTDKAFAAGKLFKTADVDLIFYTLPPTHFPPRFYL